MWYRTAFGLLFALIDKNKFCRYKKQPLEHEFQPLVPSPNPFEHNRPKVVL